LAFDKFLVYGTGGWAATHLTTQAITNATNTPLALGSTMNRGWFAGGGLDWVIYRMSPDFAAVIGVNYTHYDFDQGIHDSGVNGRFVSTTADAVTVRLSFKYDASGVLVRR
jgi:outer membrane immunogenic protein